MITKVWTKHRDGLANAFNAATKCVLSWKKCICVENPECTEPSNTSAECWGNDNVISMIQYNVSIFT